MLTKPPFVVFVGPACLLAAARIRGRRAWLHAALAAAVAFLVALPWYGPRAFGLLAQVQNRSFKQAAEAGSPEPLSAVSLAYYPLNAPGHLGVVTVVLAVVGVAVALRRRCWFVLAGLAPLLVFLLLQNKQMRYLLPLTPLLAVAGGVGFAALPRAGRAVAAAAVALAAVVQVSSTAFAVPAPSAAATPPSPARWPHRPVFAAIARDAGGAPRTLSVAVNHPHFSPANFRYYALRDGVPVRVLRAWEGEPFGIDYMVVKTGDLGPAWSIDKPRQVAERLATDRDLADAFPVVAEFPLPDGSTASLRARRLDARLGSRPRPSPGRWPPACARGSARSCARWTGSTWASSTTRASSPAGSRGCASSRPAPRSANSGGRGRPRSACATWPSLSTTCSSTRGAPLAPAASIRSAPDGSRSSA
jgi:hypothetical protein